jgi:mRNA deadenylase 3'-5' endonuclease subunit Ccr4
MTKPRKARNATKRTKKEKTQPKEETWVDRIDFYPVDAKEYPQQSTEISIISWNILANSYCSRRSQSNLPAAYQSTVFSPHRRKALICRCLRQLKADVICLQEVDMDDVGDTLRNEGYVGVETPRSQKGGGSIGGRVDSCVVYVQNANWMILEDELVRLDDLAFLSSDTCSVPDQISSSNNGNIQGIQQSFLRRNVALLVRIQHRRTKQTVVVANA